MERPRGGDSTRRREPAVAESCDALLAYHGCSEAVKPAPVSPSTPVLYSRPMIVPLTLGDFLERAETVYGDGVAVVDEPSPPGGGLGRFTYAQFGAMAR